MADPRAAAGVSASDLGSYQHAVRLVLTHDLITGTRPRPGALEQVLRWADQMAKDFRDLLGYTLIGTTHYVRLVRRFDAFDPTQGRMFAKNGRSFDRRRLAYLCLVLASFQRSRVEISLADLVRALTSAANSIGGLGYESTVPAHKAAIVDVLEWLVEHGALRLSDGSLEAWVRDSERGDALYDIDHEVCAALFKPARPVQHLTSAAGLLDAPVTIAGRTTQRDLAVQRARRSLIEQPVVYFAQVDPQVAEMLRQSDLAEDLARFTGLVVERRAEGIMLADSGGRFTDRPFPGRGGAVNRAAGLLLAKIADLLEDPDEGPRLARHEPPREADDQQDLLARIDSGLPQEGIVRALAWSPPEAPEDSTGPDTRASVIKVPLVEHSRLETMMHELYEELGATSFTNVWHHDPGGLLAAVTTFLADLRLLRPVPGGVLVLPAAWRYRNIALALPTKPKDDGQLTLGFPEPAQEAAP
jgi:uncharacterized protein (TIGR02678 family)